MKKDKFYPSYDNLTVDDLLNTAFNDKAISKMDAEEKSELIKTLAIRLQHAVNELYHIER